MDPDEAAAPASHAEERRVSLDAADTRLMHLGFRLGHGGIHSSRSIMLRDLTQLLASTPPDATARAYRTAIMAENVLGKATASNRLHAYEKLHALYGIDPSIVLFRCFRQLWDRSEVGRPVLALLLACARDPLLRSSVQVILTARHAEPIQPDRFVRAIVEALPGRFSSTNLAAIGNRLCFSWAQSGHLTGGSPRTRARAAPSPTALVYALILGKLTGTRGWLLFSSLWVRLLDAPLEELYQMSATAAQWGLMDFRRVGDVVEARFPSLLRPEEEGVISEPY